MKNSTSGPNPQGAGCNRRKVIAIAVILLVLLAIICIYGLAVYKFFPDKEFMNYKIFNLGLANSNCCSLWPISHFVLYLILGFLFPDCWVLLFVIGAAFEVFEVVVGRVVAILQIPTKGQKNKGDVEYANGWWAGSFKDVIFNAAGLATGVLLRRAWDALRKKNVKK